MQYTIKKAAERMGVTIPTLRYYDKEGLLPFIEKKSNGTRIFKDDDFQTLSLINCLKKAGVPIKEIRKYIHLCELGDSTLNQRLEIFLERKRDVLHQMQELQEVLDTIDHKISYYKKAISEGSEKLHNLNPKENR